MGWILDGNNVLGFIAAREGRDPGREGLLQRIASSRSPLPLTVVFDGPAPAGHPGGERRGRVAVTYSGRRSADDLIHALVRPGDTVVTADRELTLRCKDRQGKVVTPDRFLSGLRPRRGADAEKPSPTGVDVQDWMEFFRRGR
ncbi:MAG: hypothetical protein AB1347_04380 [Acidobacteriota bacterium]